MKSWHFRWPYRVLLLAFLFTTEPVFAQQPAAYGDGKGKLLEVIAKASRDIRLLEPVARLAADQLVWPAPFALEMQSCGFINAAWVASAHKLTLCYELAADFGELYRTYGPHRRTAGNENPNDLWGLRPE